MEPFIGQIQMFGFNFAPRGWAFCNGQLLAIAQYQALFSLLGTTYGGDGRTTFALPNLQGRLPMHFGSGPGLTPRNLGELSGQETVTLTSAQLPAHSHTAATTGATHDTPENRVPAGGGAYANSGAAATLPSGGSNQPHDNMPPYLVLNFCIALEGIYPSRS